MHNTNKGNRYKYKYRFLRKQSYTNNYTTGLEDTGGGAGVVWHRNNSTTTGDKCK